MNDATKALDVILSRRSIRSYENKPLNDTIFEHLLKAAMAAPSAHNQQPWEFVIIDERKLLDQIPEFHPYSKMLLGAPAAILVCGNKNYIKDEDLWPQDCAAATENILLAVYPKRDLMEGLSKLLNLPENIIPFSLVALGFPAKTKEPANRYDPSRVHKNKW
jgi:hypothetical protein